MVGSKRVWRSCLSMTLVTSVACSAGGSKGFGAADDDGGGAAAQGDDGGTSGSFGGDGGPGHLSADAACATSVHGAEAKPANLLFQLDVSGSMNCPASDHSSPTCAASPQSRWNVFRSALKTTLASLPSYNGAGLMHFPTGTGLFSNHTGCVPDAPDVALAPLSSSLGAIGSALDARTPAGGTPTHDGVKAALAQLAQSSVSGTKFLVLATDGAANFCSTCDISCDATAQAADNLQMVADIAAAAHAGVRTFVIGVPGSDNFRALLSRMAEAGDTKTSATCSSGDPASSPSVGTCHYDMTTAPDFGAALQAALAAINGEALSCVFDIPVDDGGAFDPSKVNVELTDNGQTHDVLQDSTHQDGWDYSSDHKQIVLYGKACDDAKHATTGKVTILFGCPTRIR